MPSYFKKQILTLVALYTLLGIVFLLNYLYINPNQNKFFISPLGNSFKVAAESPKYQNVKANKTIYGYLPYWQLNNVPFLKINHLTDIAYFGIGINKDGSLQTKEANGNLTPGYNNWINNKELNNLITKAKVNNIRIALTIISHNDENSDYFLDCVKCWDTFYTQLTAELDRKKIKDVNIDFEYEGYVKEETSKKFTNFINYIHQKLDTKYGDSKLVVAIYADSAKNSRATNPKDLGAITDGLFIMGYDFRTVNSTKTGSLAPINGSNEGKYSYDYKTMLEDLNKATDASKLILGIPYYGYNWPISNQTTTQVAGAKDEENRNLVENIKLYTLDAYTETIPGDDNIGYARSVTYAEIKKLIEKYKPEIKIDPISKTPYFIYIDEESNTKRQVFFENKDSLQYKYKLAKQTNLQGIGIWALGFDEKHQELWDLLEEEFIITTP